MTRALSLFRRRFLGGSLLGLGLLGCGGSTPNPTGPGSTELSGTRVERWGAEGGPLFHFVARKGDPEASVTQVWSVSTAEDAWLARALLEGFAPDAFEIEVGASFVALTFLHPDVGVLESRLRKLWRDFADRSTAEPRALPRALALLGAAAERTGDLEESCRGLPAVGKRTAQFSDLERVYERLRNPATWIVGAVGPRSLRERFETHPPPRGEPVPRIAEERSGPEADGEAERRAAEPALRGALRGASVEEALWLEEELGRTDSALRERLAALRPTFDVHVTGASSPGARCLFFEARLPSGAAAPDVPLAWARATFESEISRAAERSTEGRPTELLLLAQRTAARASREAALTAFVRAARGPRSVEWEVRGPRGVTLRSVDDAHRKLTIPDLETRALDEEGQAEFRILLGSPCGTRGERDADAGLRALLVSALARTADFADVRVQPWVSAEGIGLFAEGGQRRGESSAEQASRVARALAALLVRPKIEGRVLAAARESLLAELSEDPAFALGFRLLAPDHPSLLSAKGLGVSLAKLGAVDFERARSEWLNEPLRLVVAHSGDATQTEASRRAVAEILAPHRHDRVQCSTPTVEAAPPGVFSVLSVDEEVRPSRSVLVPLAVRREVGHALAEWITLRGGALDRGVRESGLVTHLAVSYVGGSPLGAATPGGLWVRFGAEAKNFEPAEHQVRAALDALSTRRASDEEVRALDARRSDWVSAIRRHPEGRLVEAFLGRASAPITAAEFEAALAALEAKKHLVVRVDRRK